MNISHKRLLALGFLVLGLLSGCANEPAKSEASEPVAYLFAYFVGNGEGQEQVHYALSSDGFNYRALNQGLPVLDSAEISRSGGVRDPHLLRGEDGLFYMVLTDLYVPTMGWENTAMVLLKSDDLIHWQHSVIDIPQTFPTPFADVNRVWAPQTIFDEQVGKYMIYFSMRQGKGADIIYYAYANADFSGLESAPKQLYFPPKHSKSRASIDGDIVKKDGKFYLFHKSEDGEPGIKLAISDHLTHGYELYSTQRIDKEENPVEGSGTFQLIGSDEYVLMYDVYTRGAYQFTKSKDLLSFEIIDHDVTMNFHPRHGSVLPVTQVEVDRLVAKRGSFEGAIASSASAQVKKMNLVIDDEKQTVFMPVKAGTDLTSFDPMLVVSPGVTYTPKGEQNFAKGPVTYLVSLNGKVKSYQISAQVQNNPVITGYYADPEIIYSEKEQKYFLYPTSDGYTGWSGSHFETFSSTDLVNWQAEGTILDLKEDVAWADVNAWAPAGIEVKQNGQYRYYYYFSAARNIGVAVADDPRGPFVASGKPLIDALPEGAEFGQQIDPDVFADPVSGKYYLYWGNGYMAMAELNADMVSLKPETLKVMTPDETFREAAEIFYRNGTYYFLWSENDTRDVDYRVRYAMSKSPTGPLLIPEDNLVIAKDAAQGIYGTGHNSVIQRPGSDEWFIIYHRFSRPKGIEMGRAAGYHREVCIDRLTFNADGTIAPVQPTLAGIAPLN